MADAPTILHQHQLRLTESRKAILSIFVGQDTALSEREIESSLAHACDRVTIYRTLATFVEKGILHKVLDDRGAMKYALCAPHCHEGEDHRHDHVHFKCTICGRTTCIDQVPIPAVHLPKGFDLQEVNMLLSGSCPECQSG